PTLSPQAGRGSSGAAPNAIALRGGRGRAAFVDEGVRPTIDSRATAFAIRRSSPMGVARHPRPKELVGVPIEEIMNRYVARFRDRKPDWAAFEDAKIEGYKRAQHRFIGAGGSGKHGDPTVIPAGNFTLSIMFVNPGQGNAAHTHEV